MNSEKIMKIFKDTAYVRTGGSSEELRAAEYIKGICAETGLAATIEEFDVNMADIRKATLTVDGKQFACKGYLCCGSGEVEADLYYLTDSDKYSLMQCKGKIVMLDGGLGYWRYRDIIENGALGFITYTGNANYSDNDIDQKELRSYVSKGEKLLGVSINVKDAIEIINCDSKSAKIEIEQDEYVGKSRNVILDIPGEISDTILLTAHYDSTSLSQGAYDNMSGSIGLLAMAEYFSKNAHRYSLRFVWCGSEERGLLGAKAYCADHAEELSGIVLNVNLDMIGCIMGKFIACCTSEKALVDYIGYMGKECGFQVKPYQGVYSSDSTPFSDNGVPSVSFARSSPSGTATIHNRYDTLKVMKAEHMQKDIEFITAFVSRMSNAKLCPVSREIPDNMKERLDEYLLRKRKD